MLARYRRGGGSTGAGAGGRGRAGCSRQRPVGEGASMASTTSGDEIDVQTLGSGARGWLRGRLDEAARQSPARLALVVFAAVVLVFTGLLSLPAASSTGRAVPFVDALFTAVSAVCVTGLTVVDTATAWSGFG